MELGVFLAGVFESVGEDGDDDFVRFLLRRAAKLRVILDRVRPMASRRAVLPRGRKVAAVRAGTSASGMDL